MTKHIWVEKKYARAIHGGGRGGGRGLIHPQVLLKCDLLTDCILFGNTKVYYYNQLVTTNAFNIETKTL